MKLEELRSYCLHKKGVSESFPFDFETLVFKVGDKMFLLCGEEDGVLSINLKCEPEIAVERREQYPAVQPGYHMNKKHWNTVLCDGSIMDNILLEWIDESYALVFAQLTAKSKLNLT